MKNQNVGIEVNGGGRHKISESTIHVKGNGKAIVLNETFDNEITKVTILLDEERKYFINLKSDLESIQDNAINPLTQKTYKNEAVNQIQKIIDLPNRETFQKNTLELISLLSSWLTIKSALAPNLTVHISELLKLIGG
ncbi:hypothetical protein [Acinetobacter pittii]|uniref:Uncharacterized protein n=1 Tax=Acinetobacter pittii TaxID=48296 RepID=A0A6H0FSI4_ACIPI|nr:hypothetical protein [Acinetobacter pittii]QIT17298.1 hypothetical protein G8E09_05985 [Acinetobacter pittii]HAV5515016.1 hypothetical protein [Acinetobacter baumannii]HAV5592567.1 hypothetical protein [Acinetobacter baumannii]